MTSNVTIRERADGSARSRCAKRCAEAASAAVSDAVRAEQARELVRRHGRAEVVALHLVARALAQERCCSGVSTPSATTVRLSVLPIAMIASVIAPSSASLARSRTNERSIFSVSIGKRFRCAERRIAGAEVVDREPHAELLDRASSLHGALGVVHHHALGDLELEQLRTPCRSRAARRDVVEQAVVAELARRQVHRDMRIGGRPCALPRARSARTRCAAPSCRSARSARSPRRAG